MEDEPPFLVAWLKDDRSAAEERQRQGDRAREPRSSRLRERVCARPSTFGHEWDKAPAFAAVESDDSLELSTSPASRPARSDRPGGRPRLTCSRSGRAGLAHQPVPGRVGSAPRSVRPRSLESLRAISAHAELERLRSTTRASPGLIAPHSRHGPLRREAAPSGLERRRPNCRTSDTDGPGLSRSRKSL